LGHQVKLGCELLAASSVNMAFYFLKVTFTEVSVLVNELELYFILLNWNGSILLGAILSCEICTLISTISLLPLTESDVFLPFCTVSQHLLQSSSLLFLLPKFKVLLKSRHVLSRKWSFF
jgi:hypothetical protein